MTDPKPDVPEDADEVPAPPAKPAQPYDERRIPARKDESDQGSLF